MGGPAACRRSLKNKVAVGEAVSLPCLRGLPLAEPPGSPPLMDGAISAKGTKSRWGRGTCWGPASHMRQEGAPQNPGHVGSGLSQAGCWDHHPCPGHCFPGVNMLAQETWPQTKFILGSEKLSSW